MLNVAIYILFERMPNELFCSVLHVLGLRVSLTPNPILTNIYTILSTLFSDNHFL